MSKSKGKLIRKTVELPAGHHWKCKEGNHLFIADRGAVMFEIPAGWVVRQEKPDTTTLHERPPPDDNARISLTVFHLPPVGGGWSGLPLEQLLIATAMGVESKNEPESTPGGSGASDQSTGAPLLKIHRLSRSDVELIWAEKPAWTDPADNRRIRCRQIIARARLVQVLMTVDVYEDYWPQYQPAWDDLLRSLRVAVPVDFAGEVGN